MQFLITKATAEQPLRIAGLMSGTSMDAIDCALAEYWWEGEQCRMNILGGASSQIRNDEREFFLRCIEQPQSMSVFSDLGVYWALRNAEAVKAACLQSALLLETIDAVGVHGQTLWHSPNSHPFLDRDCASTLQIMSLPTLAEQVQCVCVGDFRMADVAAGGQGAPLVAQFDWEFLRDAERDVAALNIGGMSNLTLIPKDANHDDIRAFDCGPGNVWIDAAMNHYFNAPYDDGGRKAAEGKLVETLLSTLQALEFVHQAPPKSTGREQFSLSAFQELVVKSFVQCPAVDVLHTLTRFTAWCIAEHVRRYFKSDARLVIAGGGVKNGLMMRMLQEELPEAELCSSEQLGIPSQWKEALCFGYLAFRTLSGKASNIPSVSGARNRRILGQIAPFFPFET